jgi:hypothetical protein
MCDERELIARVESASVAELAQILARRTAQQERTLRVHYGDERYNRMRALRALVVADPAEDAPLPGAEEEGRAIAELFNAFGRNYDSAEYSVEVDTLFGPAGVKQTTQTASTLSPINISYTFLRRRGFSFDAM